MTHLNNMPETKSCATPFDWIVGICFALIVLVLALAALTMAIGCNSVKGGSKTTEAREQFQAGTVATTQQTTTTGTTEQTASERSQSAGVHMENYSRQTIFLRSDGTIVVNTDRGGAASTQPAIIERSTASATQPSVTTTETRQVTGPQRNAIRTSLDRGPEASGQDMPSLGKDGSVGWSQADPALWIYPTAAIILGVLAAVATFYFPKSPTLGACLGGMAAVCMAYKFVGIIIAIIIGVAAVAGLLALIVYIRHRDETNWRASLPGVAKLIGENKPGEAIAALRGSTPEMDAAFKTAPEGK